MYTHLHDIIITASLIQHNLHFSSLIDHSNLFTLFSYHVKCQSCRSGLAANNANILSCCNFASSMGITDLLGSKLSHARCDMVLRHARHADLLPWPLDHRVYLPLLEHQRMNITVDTSYLFSCLPEWHFELYAQNAVRDGDSSALVLCRVAHAKSHQSDKPKARHAVSMLTNSAKLSCGARQSLARSPNCGALYCDHFLMARQHLRS